MSERKKATLLWGTAAGVAVIGAVVLTIGLLTPVSFGWFAYQPLAEAEFVPSGGLFLSHATIVGLIILVIGILSIAFLAGWRAARRRPDRLDPDVAD